MKKHLKLLLISIVMVALSLGIAACNLSFPYDGNSGSSSSGGSSGGGSSIGGDSSISDEPYLTIVNAPSSFIIGDKGTFSAETSDYDSVDITWSVNSSSVLSVTTSGTYEALSEGEFTVTAQADGYLSATLEGQVKKSDVVPMLELDDNIKLYYGDKYQLIPYVTYNGEDVDFADLTMTFVVADPTVLSIDENGNVTTLKKEDCSTSVDVTVTYGDYTFDAVTVTVTIKTKTYIALNVYQNVELNDDASSCIKRTSSKITADVTVFENGTVVSDPSYTLSVIEGEQFVEKRADGEYNAVAGGKVTFKAECEINGQAYSSTYSVNVVQSSYTCHDLTVKDGVLTCANDGCEFTCEKQKRYVDIDGITVENAVGCFVDGEYRSLKNGKLEFTKKEIIEFNRQEKELQFIKEDLSAEIVFATMYTKIIDSVDDLRSAKDYLDDEGCAFFKLEADLTVGDWNSTDRINEFNNGIFDGGKYDEDGELIGKYKISGLNLTGSGEFGLFGFTTGSTFKNFEVEMTMNVSATKDGGAALIFQTAGGNIENVKLTVTTGVGIGASGDRIYGALVARQWASGTTVIKDCEIIGDSNTAGANSFAAIINVNMGQDAHITIENVKIENFATALSMYNDPARLTAQEVKDGGCSKVTATNLTSEITIGVYGNNYLDADGTISGFTIESGEADVYVKDVKVGSVSNGTLALTESLTIGNEYRLELKDSSGAAVSLFKNSTEATATDKLNVMYVSKIIKTVDELKSVVDNLSGAYLKLEADLTVGDWNSTDCINEFNNGIFDGGKYDENGNLIGKHKISGLNLTGNGEFGLFGFTKGSTFKNFEVEMTMNVSATTEGGAALIFQTAGGNIENVKLTVTTGVGIGASGDRIYGALVARQWASGTTVIKDCEIIGDSNTAGANSFAAIINVNMGQDAHITIENVKIENFATALSMYNDPARLTAQEVKDGGCSKVTATDLTSEMTV